MSSILKTTTFDPARLSLEETLYHTANGYLGVRAAFEEGYAAGTATVRGSYINAFYDTHPIRHPESLYGFPETGERIVAVTDAQTIELYVDGEKMVLEPGRLESFERTLDMEAGIARRSFVWNTAAGKRLEVTVSRLCSLARPELFAVEYRVASLGEGAEIRLACVLDGDVSNYHDESDPRLSGSAFKPLEVLAVEAVVGDGFDVGPAAPRMQTAVAATSTATIRGSLYIESRTKVTGFRLGVLSLVESSGMGTWAAEAGPAEARLELSRSLSAGEELVVLRKNVYVDSERHGEVRAAAGRIAKALGGIGFSGLAAEQAETFRAYWEAASVSVEGDEPVAEGLRFGLFQLLQSAPRDGRSNIAAKALSGEGYEGHYFWDTEIYMAPFFTYTNPALARALLLYRHSILDGARAHAREMGQTRGAAFPWRTIAGRECSAYYPSGSAQYHINADIAYAVWRYYEATGDLAFIAEEGAELLFETARTWLDIGHFDGSEFRIESVTGPDEYTCLVDNNYYTNAMARYALERAVEAHALLRDRDPPALAGIALRIRLAEDEVVQWSRAAAAMYLPYDAARDISPQDDGFLRKAIWDPAGIPAEERPLLLHFHHLAISRRQICKQADVVLAHFLLPGIAASGTIRKSYEYYERITTHDSSLSYAVFSAMAARLGDAEKAYRYFAETARLDLDDRHGNARDGIHAANMGGAWLAIVFGFGGFQPLGDAVALEPVLPARWRSLSFRIAYRGRSIRVRASREGQSGGRLSKEGEGGIVVRVELAAGNPIGIESGGRRFLLVDLLVFMAQDRSRSAP